MLIQPSPRITTGPSNATSRAVRFGWNAVETLCMLTGRRLSFISSSNRPGTGSSWATNSARSSRKASWCCSAPTYLTIYLSTPSLSPIPGRVRPCSSGAQSIAARTAASTFVTSAGTMVGGAGTTTGSTTPGCCSRKLVFGPWALGSSDPLTLVLPARQRAGFFVTMLLELGEYARDHGFWLPNPVSICPEYLRLRFEVV